MFLLTRVVYLLRVCCFFSVLYVVCVCVVYDAFRAAVCVSLVLRETVLHVRWTRKEL